MGDFLAYELLPVILNMTLTASVVIVLVLLARLALRRAPRVCSYALWLVVLFRLLCPVSLTADISLMGLLDTPVTEVTAHTSAAAYVPRDVVHAPAPAVELPVPGVGEAVTDALPQGEEQTAADPLEAPMAIATLIWMAGVAAMVIWGAVSLVRLRRRLVGAVPLERGVYLADHIDTPFVLGLFRPKIYLPSALAERERGYILLHERHHIRRLDHAVKLLAFLTLCIHWFNPLVWLMFVLLGRDMEISCDEAVMKRLGEAVRADYSASLLRLATGRKIIAGAPLAFGEGDTRDRVKNVLQWKRPRLWGVLAGAAVCAAVIAACAVNPGEDSGEVPEEITGTYASMEDYANSRVQEILDGNTVTYSIADENGAYTGQSVTDTVEDARGEVIFLGSLEGLDPEGRLEAWEFSWEIKPTNAQNHAIFIAGGGGVLEDGFCDFGQSDLLVVRCRNDDGRYEILWQETAPEHIDFFGYHNGYEEALYDWYVTEYGLDLPLYVEDWIDRVEVPEGGSLGNFPVHRFDGDGWYLYIPVSAWEQVLTEDPEAQWQWVSAYGTGSTLLVERLDTPLEDQQAALEGQGFIPEDGGNLVWAYPGGNIRCWLYETSDSCLRVTTDYDLSRITDYPYIAMQPQVLALMAESFTLDQRITNRPRLTLEDVRELAEQKGEMLSWADFEAYDYIETGSGLYIRVYPIDGTFSLSIGGGRPDQEDPLYIHLNCGEDFIDIRREDVGAFIRDHLSGGGADDTGSVKVSLTEGGRFSPTKAEWLPNGDAQEVTTADIAETVASRTLLDGTEVLFYLSAAGDKYCAYIPAGTERLIRFTYESNVYTEDYGISLYENVLGTSGFRIECPRGAAYYANDYYYFDEDGTLWLLARCSSEALEVDLNSDGQKELLCSYHGYELYYDTMIGGQLYEADLCDLTAQALGYQRGNDVQVALEVPENVEDFADGETGYTLTLLEEDGNLRERLTGSIRLSADTLEVLSLKN